MSFPPRRGAHNQAPPERYTAVPQRSPQHQPSARRQNYRAPSAIVNGPRQIPQSGRGAITQGVAKGAIGAGYGPYSYNPNEARGAGMHQQSRFTAPPPPSPTPPPQPQPKKPNTLTKAKHAAAASNSTTLAQFQWDKDPEVDDALHNPDPRRDAKLDRSCDPFSFRGWVNAGMIFVLIMGLLTLFAGYPIIIEYSKPPEVIQGWNVGGINSTGQIPDLPGLPTLIDKDTPSSAYTRTGHDGRRYNLVFSDEFEKEGRTFYPGEDPFWEAVDIHYWPTVDIEWYDPSAITTQNGKLVITMQEKSSHGLNFESGMLQSWNKVCFNTGYIEVSISMPGSPRTPGLWPGAWTLGNLGRAGYGSTTEGMWPYSYDSCDLGTFPNQTRDGAPEAARGLSYLPGQRVSACTCPGSDHPGPTVGTGRGVPEIDIIEAQIDTNRWQGEVSQSFQIAPYNHNYEFVQTSPETIVHNDSNTYINSYKGGPFQQAVSAVSWIGDEFYNDTGYAPYGFEWWSNPSRRSEGYITWFYNNQPTWTVTAASVGPDPVTQVSARLIPEEPMYVVLNLGMSPSFQRQDFRNLEFPARMYIDYVRIYQREDARDGVTCDPPSRPTSDYIERHMSAYMNPNFTTWVQAGNTFPRNSLLHGC
ncbi:hypothetical protein AX16_007952 [Volvariella volvacea WC 439]|nr:hypothetical protein AX16_007952 [Volvariella volvacea WC 439]